MSSINPHPVPGAVVRNVSGAREELLTVALVRDVGSGLLEENVRHGRESWMAIMDGHHGGIMLPGCVLWCYGWMGVMAHCSSQCAHCTA